MSTNKSEIQAYLLQMLKQKGFDVEKIDLEIKHLRVTLTRNLATGVASYTSNHLNGFFFLIPENSYGVEIQVSGQTEMFIYPDDYTPNHISLPIFRKQLKIRTLTKTNVGRNIKFNVWQISVKKAT